MAEQTHNRDMTDQSDRQDLEDRVEQLESTISKMLPSRRDALKLGGAALVGGAAMSGSASAGTQQAGTIGTSGALVDVESEDINNADTITTDTLDSVTLNNADTVTTDTLDSRIVKLGTGRNAPGGRMLNMSAFSGSNPNQRFDNCLAEALDGDIVMLESGVSSDKTINKRIILEGSGESTAFRANLTVNNKSVILRDFRINRFDGHTLTVDDRQANISGLYFPDIVINGNNSVVFANLAGSITDNGTGNAVFGNN
jgi:hypothetical protein